MHNIFDCKIKNTLYFELSYITFNIVKKKIKYVNNINHKQ
jgi:hypothetical protein